MHAVDGLAGDVTDAGDDAWRVVRTVGAEEEPEPEIEWDWFSSDQMEDVTPENFGRISSQTAKQVLKQRIQETTGASPLDGRPGVTVYQAPPR